MPHDLNTEPAWLRDALADESGLLDRWLENATHNSWFLRQQISVYPQLRERCAAFITALRESLVGLKTFQAGSPELREPLQIFTFTAGWMAGVGMPIGSVVALSMGLTDALGGRGNGFLCSLLMAATEAHAAGIEQKARASHRAIIAKSQVVCLLSHDLPALFLVGDPDQSALDDAVSRLMMLALMRESKILIIEASGLRDPETVLCGIVGILRDEAVDSSRTLMVCGISNKLAEQLVAQHGPHGWMPYEELHPALDAVHISPELG